MLVWKWEITKQGKAVAFGRTHTKLDALTKVQEHLTRGMISDSIDDSFVVSIRFDDHEDNMRKELVQAAAEAQEIFDLDELERHSASLPFVKE